MYLWCVCKQEGGGACEWGVVAVLLLCRAVLLLLGMRVLSRRLHVLPLHPSHLLLYELLLDTICAHLQHLSKRLDRHPIRQILYIVNGEGMCSEGGGCVLGGCCCSVTCIF